MAAWIRLAINMESIRWIKDLFWRENFEFVNGLDGSGVNREGEAKDDIQNFA